MIGFLSLVGGWIRLGNSALLRTRNRLNNDFSNSDWEWEGSGERHLENRSGF